MKKRIVLIIAVVLVLVMALSFALTACNDQNNGGNNNQTNTGDNGNTNTNTGDNGNTNTGDNGNNGGNGQPAADDVLRFDLTLTDNEDHEGDEFYADYVATFGDFYKLYTAAKAQEDVDAKWVGMAMAEAKLLESGAFLPTTCKGGRYAITKVAYGTVCPTLWGTDSSRFHNALVTTEAIKLVDRDALKALYKEKKGTGTYAAAAKAYLEGKGYTITDTYNMAYSEDPATWDITNTYRSVDNEAIVNTYDGLIEYDNEGVMHPALATSWTISEDGLTYTFNIREGVMWVDKDGRDFAEVSAQNWVDALKRNIAAGDDGTSSLVTPLIAGAQAYADGETDDFSTVGIKAVSKYVLQYTLEEPCSYFLSMFNYSPFAPICSEYVASNENYGQGPDNIVYCGPYVVTNYTKDNKIVFSANTKYWNKDAITLKTINWFNYGSNDDVTATYTDFKAGTIDGCGLNTSTVPMAKADNLWDYVYVSGTDATAYSFFYNVARQAYATEGYADTTSTQTADDKAITAAAMKNANFRMAFARGLNRVAYNAIAVGEDCASYSLINSYVPGTFVSLTKDVKVEMNGQVVTFAAGTYYGAIVQAQLDADMGEKAIKAWDPEADGGIGSSAGYDGWYNKEIAIEYLNKAIEELAAQGVTVDADHPIKIDYPVYITYDLYAARANAIKQAIDETFGGKVVLNIVGTNYRGWLTVGYFAKDGSECNYDLYDCSGWGPDYGDPSSYLNTMLPVNGDMIKMCGLY